MTKKLSNVSLKEFRAFLKHHGLNKHGINSGHEYWSKTVLTRPVTFQTHIDPIPAFIVSNNLRTMGLTSADLREFFESPKKAKKKPS